MDGSDSDDLEVEDEGRRGDRRQVHMEAEGGLEFVVHTTAVVNRGRVVDPLGAAGGDVLSQLVDQHLAVTDLSRRRQEYISRDQQVVTIGC